MGKLELYYPVKPLSVSQGFGENKDFYKTHLGIEGHNGWDMRAPDGMIVRATHDGIVTFTGEDGAGGQTIVIRTEKKFDYNEIDDVFFKTIYGHLQKESFVIKANQIVKTGDIIAKADNTGFSTGSHLHFGLKPVKQGEAEYLFENIEQNNGFRGAIDPRSYFTGIYAADAQTYFSILKTEVSILEKIIFIYNKLLNK